MIGDYRNCKEDDRKICIGCYWYDECDRHSTGMAAVYGGIAFLAAIAIIMIFSI